MSTINTIHTLVPNANIPLGFLDEDNIRFLQRKIVEVLKREYKQDILIDRASIIRIMERAIVDGRIEPVPKMNQRVIMMICNEFRVHQRQVNKHLKWEAHYVLSQRAYDPSVEVSRFDVGKKSLKEDFRGQRVGGTTRFYFT